MPSLDGQSPTLPGLFEQERGKAEIWHFARDSVLLRGYAGSWDKQLLALIEQITEQAPFRRMSTPGGRQMSVEMSNCGQFGWVSDRKGYRYAARDPANDRPWPPMPARFLDLAAAAADKAGFAEFSPDSCLINRYRPGARLSLHQDRDELDFSAPIVSVSLGLPAVFLFGGAKRSEKQTRIPLDHGDVLVWGGASRLNYHGIQPLEEGTHPLFGACRINLTFRKSR
ncbi:DNA oxidative demethylase AlkB [Fodinicurvata fenggangensis]|uniref:DNA oxidative demethylase AlkB n=1 Tax=Fodinicurvata fenggangensis TaxID=1121830 RepID=UPI00068E663A|nr:DNA oxidative demethylase AlkB [Fodinicurvata fenggangensis]